jgi:hypothetical protein
METCFLNRGKARLVEKYSYLSAAIPRMRDTTPPLVVQGLHVAHRLGKQERKIKTSSFIAFNVHPESKYV